MLNWANRQFIDNPLVCPLYLYHIQFTCLSRPLCFSYLRHKKLINEKWAATRVAVGENNRRLHWDKKRWWGGMKHEFFLPSSAFQISLRIITLETWRGLFVYWSIHNQNPMPLFLKVWCWTLWAPPTHAHIHMHISTPQKKYTYIYPAPQKKFIECIWQPAAAWFCCEQVGWWVGAGLRG